MTVLQVLIGVLVLSVIASVIGGNGLIISYTEAWNCATNTAILCLGGIRELS